MIKYIFRNKLKFIYILYATCYILSLSGCTTVPAYVKPASVKPIGIPGIYHRVVKGQTLWSISKTYGVDLEELVRVNQIANATAIEIGQQIFIPNRFGPQPQPVQYTENESFIWPLRGRITGSFGQTINNILNKGVNIQPYGSLEVSASRGGRVVFSSDDFAGFGKTIIIDHQDGLFTVYARNSETLVKAGETVQKGAIIAKAGSSGRDRTIYLHFEIRKGFNPQNPLFYLP